MWFAFWTMRDGVYEISGANVRFHRSVSLKVLGIPEILTNALSYM